MRCARLVTGVLLALSCLLCRGAIRGIGRGAMPVQNEIIMQSGKEAASLERDGTVQVVSDVDDTIKSSGNLRCLGIPLGGVDAQYKRNTFYPGVMQFAIEIARGGNDKIRDIPRLAVLTARAREFKFALELSNSSVINRNYHLAGQANGLTDWGIGRVLYGSVKEWIFQDLKADRKFKNFNRLQRELPPSAAFVFIGDTGEKDERAATMIAKKFESKILAVFLHAVSEEGRVAKLPHDREIRHKSGDKTPVLYFRTYVGAAQKAYQIGLMNEAGVKRVIKSSKSALRGVPKQSTQWQDLLEDIKAAKDSMAPFRISQFYF